jgi:hypothetical protein
MAKAAGSILPGAFCLLIILVSVASIQQVSADPSWKKLSGTTLSGPAVGMLDNLYVVVRGTSGGIIYWSSVNTGT